MSYPSFPHPINKADKINEEKQLTSRRPELPLTCGASHTYKMKRTYYTKTDEGNYLPAHIGFDHMSDILATIMADQMRDMIVTKIGNIIDGIDIDQKVREAIDGVDASEMAEEAVREAIEDMVSNNLSVDVSI
jgi:uncharacterized membrane protein YheB (UPF0754 family)